MCAPPRPRICSASVVSMTGSDSAGPDIRADSIGTNESKYRCHASPSMCSTVKAKVSGGCSGGRVSLGEMT
jgi:hypothetical protein